MALDRQESNQNRAPAREPAAVVRFFTTAVYHMGGRAEWVVE